MRALLRSIAISLIYIFMASCLFAEIFTFSADKKSGSRAKGREKIVLEGRAVLASESLTLNADRIEIIGEDFDLIVCTGNVRGVDSEKGLYFATDRLSYDRIAKITRLIGNSTMEDKQNEVVAKARIIEYNDEKGVSLLQIAVRIFKGDLVCRANWALWRREEKDLELASSPVVFKGDDEFRAARMKINLDTEELLMEGRVSGTLKVTSKEDE